VTLDPMGNSFSLPAKSYLGLMNRYL